MHDDQLNQLVARHAVFTTTAMHMQHPGDDYEGWRRDWAEVKDYDTLVKETVKCPGEPEKRIAPE